MRAHVATVFGKSTQIRAGWPTKSDPTVPLVPFGRANQVVDQDYRCCPRYLHPMVLCCR